MKIRFERGDTVLQYERKPMKEGRFRVLCLLAAAGLYGGMVVGVAKTCGFMGLILVALVTVVSLSFCVMD